ncbi:hypothetical protein GC105_03475 [Alkalibaculum sp. M08DMB]|uniref:Twitching motility protein PilT n=1 Tax=Alkalibaculum sporogenes TaxID=2655001 RepID=A0A6A7K601_9FIRM|nr:hypothetical protein [Alkalibaculum sporogenes]MPW24850.1 hypothetical protein [Alkalibaculum sporogenes]
MVKIISGPKGSGKTKKIINIANSKINETMGEVVFINDREKYREKLNRAIRYVNADEFRISSSDILFGFLNGLIAENYDIDTIYIDNLLRICRVDNVDEINEFLSGLNNIENKYNTKFVLSVTSEKEEMVELQNAYAE